MFFQYKDIDFDYNEKCVTENDIKCFFYNIIKIAKKTQANIFEIAIEEKDFTMIYIEKNGKPDEWDKETIDFCNALENYGYEVLFADEDYGEGLDVLLLYDKINAINALFF